MVIYTKTAVQMSYWRENEIRDLRWVTDEAEIVRQIQKTARDSVVYDQITNWVCERVMSCLVHAPPRRHPKLN